MDLGLNASPWVALAGTVSTALEKWSEETGKQLNGQGQGLTVRFCFGGRWEVMTMSLKSHTLRRSRLWKLERWL